MRKSDKKHILLASEGQIDKASRTGLIPVEVLDKMLADMGGATDVRPEEVGHLHYRDMVDLGSPQHFDVGNVARVLYDEAVARAAEGKESESAMDIATLAPPFEYTIFHYLLRHTDPQNPGRIVTESTKAEVFGIDLKHLPEDREGVPVVAWGFEEEARWWIQIDLTVDDEERLAGIELQIDELGQAMPHTLNYYYSRTYTAVAELAGIPREDWYKAVNSMIYPAFFSLSLLNCKNVAVAERKISRQQIRKYQRKGGPKPIQYRTLVIAPFMQQAVASAGSGKSGVSRAFHMARGSFATYTKEKPAFGQPWGVGTFWRPASAKGSMAKGQIEKDYKIDTRTPATAGAAPATAGAAPATAGAAPDD